MIRTASVSALFAGTCYSSRALHGEVTLAGEKHRVIAFQRGGVQRSAGHHSR